MGLLSHSVTMHKLGLPEGGGNDKDGGRWQEKDGTKKRGSDQETKFSIQHCIFIGRAHRTHPLFQLDYVTKQSQHAVYSFKLL